MISMPAIVQAGRPKRLEAQHGTRKPFYCAIILLDDIIETGYPLHAHTAGLPQLMELYGIWSRAIACLVKR